MFIGMQKYVQDLKRNVNTFRMQQSWFSIFDKTSVQIIGYVYQTWTNLLPTNKCTMHKLIGTIIASEFTISAVFICFYVAILMH